MSRISQEEDAPIKSGILQPGLVKRGRIQKADTRCEHGKFRSVCGKHPKIFARGLTEESYQQMLNLKAKIAYDNGHDRNIPWWQFFELFTKNLPKEYEKIE